MKKINNIKYTLLMALAALVSCEDYLEPEVSPDQIYYETIFESEETAEAAIYGLYADFVLGSSPVYLMNGSLSVMGGLVSDELYDFSQAYLHYDVNEIISTGFEPAFYYWSETYRHVYTANAIIEGVESSNLDEDLKNQIAGEAYFVRGLLYFQLLNIYGNIPIVTNTLYSENAAQPQAPAAEVYEQIISDLQQAESLLTEDYVSEGKVRPNKYVVQALLARVNLYRENWAKAEEYATQVINGPYSLSEDLSGVFDIASEGAIWQLIPSNPNSGSANEVRWFTPGQTPTYVLTENLLDAFEEQDKRRTAWVGEVEYADGLYFYPTKFVPGTTLDQYSTVFRIAEQYLIRAEARARLGNLEGAIEDLNEVRRVHGGLEPYAGPVTEEAVIEAILQERRVEFFAEWGHRWFDLIRTGRAGEVLGELHPETWEPTDILWPIPSSELEANPELEQNPGYN